ncbi:head GIN domain-containing protein [Pedobacter sp.]|jgi:hypothetical protein|uniref:head GIN domain-containing protein n=1 Tax=Pedobacter sp. TaxID=1411316 RepID=UPI002BA64CCA|nr:head GIN domain-containing protein [Pedobacter sp.]HWW43333.1 head GIN domain-containing protein [Pedobacter sp.]
MKKLTFLILLLPILWSACKTKCVEDSGVRALRAQTVKEFNEIEIAGPIKLVLHQVPDSVYQVKVSADSNVVNLIETKVSGGTLKLKLDTAAYCGKDSIVVYASIAQLKSLKAESPSKVVSSGRLNVDDLKLTLNGSTEVNLDLNAGKVTTEVDGATKIHLTGQAGTHLFKAKGAVELDAFDFVVGIYDLNIKGVGKANINVLNDLKVATSGATSISYKGNPKNVKEDKSGSSSIQQVK